MFLRAVLLYQTFSLSATRIWRGFAKDDDGGLHLDWFINQLMWRLFLFWQRETWRAFWRRPPVLTPAIMTVVLVALSWFMAARVLPSEVATTRSIKIITSEIIYRLIDELEAWQKEMRLEKEKGILDLLVKPCKIMILKGYVFRQSNPAIVGCEVLEGKAKVSTSIMNSKGEEITSIKSIQQEQESINEVEKGKQVAISFDGVIVGRQIKEGDILYSAVPEEHFRRMKVLKDYLKRDVIDLLKEIAEIKRKENPVWGI